MGYPIHGLLDLWVARSKECLTHGLCDLWVTRSDFSFCLAFGPAFTYTNVTEFIAKLQTLVAAGGGDCPEMCMSGVQLSLQAVFPRSQIFIFTDASAKDWQLESDIINLIQLKQSQLYYVLTGDCGNPNDPGSTVYQNTSDASNGHVFHVDKENVSDVRICLDIEGIR